MTIHWCGTGLSSIPEAYSQMVAPLRPRRVFICSLPARAIAPMVSMPIPASRSAVVLPTNIISRAGSGQRIA